MRHWSRHVFAKPPECHILASYQMWFAKNCSKMPKLTAKWRRFGDFCDNPNLVAIHLHASVTWYQNCWEPDSLINYYNLAVNFGIFSNFWPTTSGSSPKCDILEVWAVHVCTGYSTDVLACRTVGTRHQIIKSGRLLTSMSWMHIAHHTVSSICIIVTVKGKRLNRPGRRSTVY